MFKIICRYSHTCTYSLYINTYTHCIGRCGSELGTTNTICDIHVKFVMSMCYFRYSCVISDIHVFPKLGSQIKFVIFMCYLWYSCVIWDKHVLFPIFMCYFRTWDRRYNLWYSCAICDIHVLFAIFICFRTWDRRYNLWYSCAISSIHVLSPIFMCYFRYSSVISDIHVLFLILRSQM